MENINELTLSEFSDVFNYLLDNNRRLSDSNQTPISIGLEGIAGIGKTAIVEEIANKRGMTFCKLNLSQLEEVGDLCGFPQKEYYVTWINKEGKQASKWMPEALLHNVPAKVNITGKTRMGYASPAWLPREENPNGTILLLDDYTRANSLFMRATMELINTAQYISWKLPNNTTVVLEK